MSRCPKKKTLFYYVDGFLPRQKRERVEQHLKICDKCRAEVEANQVFKNIPVLPAGTLPDEQYWESFLPRLEKRLRGREQVVPGRILAEKVNGFTLILTFLAVFTGLILQTNLVEIVIRKLGVIQWGKTYFPNWDLPEFWVAFILVIISSNLILVMSIPFFWKKKEQLTLRLTH